jgi:hypothetical protein
MRLIKTVLFVGALVIASSGAYAQTIATNVGVNLGSPNYYANRQNTGLNSYDRARPVRVTVRARPRSYYV